MDTNAQQATDLIQVDLANGRIQVERDGTTTEYDMASPEAFAIMSKAWLRCGWDTKYVYGFSWLGRPIIQLPEDLLRIQQVIFDIKPDVIIETGVAHGGSLVFYATVCKAMDKGHVIGVDIEIRPHNRSALEQHCLFPYITLVEGDSVAPEIVEQVRSLVGHAQTVLVCLDSCHTKQHSLNELHAYAPLVTPGSYIVVMDGIMKDLAGAPRSNPDWEWNNPYEAIKDFVASHGDFVVEEPDFGFNEGMIQQRVTYWPNAFIRRIR